MHPAVSRIAAAALMTALAGTAVRAAGDPALGKTQFNKCAACHSIKAGENKIGPSLHGVVGRPSHSIESFNYSEAMKGYNVTWTDEELNKYLENPRGVVTGTKMIFVGLKKEDERANLIAYLDTLK